MIPCVTLLSCFSLCPPVFSCCFLVLLCVPDVTLRSPVLLCVTLCSPVLLCVPLWYSVFPCVTLCYPMFACVPLCYPVFCCITLCDPVLHCVPLCPPVLPLLACDTPCYLVLLCVILFSLCSPVFSRAQLFESRLALNPGLNLTQVFFLLCSKAFSRIIFSAIFRASNHQLVDKKN